MVLETGYNRTFTGQYIENAAYNISINPMVLALSNLGLSLFSYGDISRAIIAEPRTNMVSQINAARNLLYSVNQGIDLEVVLLN